MVDPKALLNRRQLAALVGEPYQTVTTWERKRYIAPIGKNAGYSLLGTVQCAIFAELANEKTASLKHQAAIAFDLVAQLRDKLEAIQGRTDGPVNVYALVVDGNVAPLLCLNSEELRRGVEYLTACVEQGQMLAPPHTKVSSLKVYNLTEAVGIALEGVLKKSGQLEAVDAAIDAEQDRFDRTPSTAYGEQLPAVLVGWLGDQRAALEALPPAKRSMWGRDLAQRGAETVAQHVVADLRAKDPKAASFLDADTEPALVRALKQLLKAVFAAPIGKPGALRIEGQRAATFPPQQVTEQRKATDE